MRMLISIGCLLISLTSARAMTVDEVIVLSKQGLSAKEIIRQIHDKRVVFKLESADTTRLIDAGVERTVIYWMLDSPIIYGVGSETQLRALIASAQRRSPEALEIEADRATLNARKAWGGALGVIGGLAGTLGLIVAGLQSEGPDGADAANLPATWIGLSGVVLFTMGVSLLPKAHEIDELDRRARDARVRGLRTKPRAFLSTPVIQF